MLSLCSWWDCDDRDSWCSSRVYCDPWEYEGTNLAQDGGIDLLLCCRWLCSMGISLLIRDEVWGLNAERINNNSINYWVSAYHPEVIRVHKLTIAVRAVKMPFNLMLSNLGWAKFQDRVLVVTIHDNNNSTCTDLYLSFSSIVHVYIPVSTVS